ncbi:ferritin family protein [Streptomyces sp. ME03-5709C]|nr:ferritin family protein [Streptomyces sp. ME03-5709C]
MPAARFPDHEEVSVIPHRICALAAVALAVGLSTPAVAVRPPMGGMPHGLHAGTSADLEKSLRGEAFANASYSVFAEQARAQKLPAVATLFQRVASVELGEHFTEAATLTGLVGSDAANLRAAAEGESYESRVMYPGFARQAKEDGDTKAAELFAEIAKDEAAHHQRFLAALRVLTTGKGSIPKPPDVSPERVRAGMPQVRAARTKANLDTAMHGEALAHAKYALFAKHAEAWGNKPLARLFSGAGDVELREHFTGEAALAGLVRSARDNLTTAVTGEQYESRTMYPDFARKAQAAGDTGAAALFRNDAGDEAGHARDFVAARQALR